MITQLICSSTICLLAPRHRDGPVRRPKRRASAPCQFQECSDLERCRHQPRSSKPCATALFVTPPAILASHDAISWLYPQDGCQVRAELAASMAGDAGKGETIQAVVLCG